MDVGKSPLVKAAHQLSQEEKKRLAQELDETHNFYDVCTL